MKKSNLALTVLFALGVTACGSSGGGSSSDSIKTTDTLTNKDKVVNIAKADKPTSQNNTSARETNTPVSQDSPASRNKYTSFSRQSSDRNKYTSFSRQSSKQKQIHQFLKTVQQAETNTPVSQDSPASRNKYTSLSR
ncbi:hypothetical protein [Actinobacillus arthritidis]|uniref:hypothetical protein n=1 Tax=Actinobacillus arthritidis TaxID=157339 RepID=UPI0024423F7C|nr:hypothetical protein [Actinobacillus arthritidis]WGE89381.1 hypothetical protein NYR89_10610 [Actinobacillus arthritidis]